MFAQVEFGLCDEKECISIIFPKLSLLLFLDNAHLHTKHFPHRTRLRILVHNSL